MFYFFSKWKNGGIVFYECLFLNVFVLWIDDWWCMLFLWIFYFVYLVVKVYNLLVNIFNDEFLKYLRL